MKPSILNKIIQEKRREIIAAKNRTSLEALKQIALSHSPCKAYDTLVSAQYPRIIAEVKRASPSRGPIRPDLDPVECAVQYTESGAAWISVLTDQKFFDGSLEFLQAIRKRVSTTPLLRKDFIVDEHQIWEARAYGADAILLIAAACEAELLQELCLLAAEAELAVLLEVHNEVELQTALKLLKNPQCKFVLGVNNRDLNTFETDLAVFGRLASAFNQSLKDAKLSYNLPIIAESGIYTVDDIKILENAGAGGFLIGESLVKQGLPGDNLTKLREEVINREKTL